MVGAMFSSAMNIESGKNKTRKDEHPASDVFDGSFDGKYAIGALNHATILRGGVLGEAPPGGVTSYDHGDQFVAIGSVGVGQMNLWKIESLDPESGSDAAYKRIYAKALAGGEFIAQVGRRMPLNFGATGNGPFDLRQLFLKEEDDWEVQVAGAQTMIGATVSAVVDAKKSSTTNAPAHFWGAEGCGPQNMGAVSAAIGLKALIAGAVRKSWINVENSANVYAVSTFQEIWHQVEDDSECSDDRPGSLVRNLFGVYVQPIIMGPPATATDVGRAIGVYVGNTQPELVIGADPLPLLNSNECGGDDPCGSSQYRGASIVTQGTTVFGDNLSDEEITGWTTDVVHIEGVMRLRGRTAPPTFSCCLPHAERVGLLYYDTTASALRLSVPGSLSGQIKWVKLAIVTETSPGPPTDSTCVDEELKSGAPPTTEEQRREQHVASVNDGTSSYLPPSVEALPVFPVSQGHSPEITLFTSGFMREEPIFFYSRVGTDGDLGAAVPWTQIPEEFISPVSGLADDSDAFTITYPFNGAGSNGVGPQPGDHIRIVARSRTDGRTAGTTVIYPATEKASHP